MNKVLIPTKLSDVAANTLKTAGYEVIQDADTPLEKQVAAHPDAVALIVRSEKVTPEIMDALPSLKLVVRAGAGYDNIDIVYARKKNVDVMNTPGANSNAVAEEVMAMILAYYRHIVQADATTREGLWEKKKYMGSELTKKTVGIIGLGKIGTRTAELMHAFGAKILAQSRTKHTGAAEYITQVSQEELLRQSDIVVLHCPLNDSTRGMIDAEKLAMMKPSAYLINVARGPVVVAADLAAALNQGVIAGAAVDVFDKEPPLDASEPLLNCKNCLVTPHIAFASKESMSIRAEIVFDNLASWMAGQQKNVIL